MKANPGGTIGPKDVIGRDELIKSLWQSLENQSLVLTSERRIGKTSVIRKMKAEAADSKVFCVLRDLEGLRSPQEFVECVYQDIEDHLKRTDRARLKVQQLLVKLGGAQIGDVKLPNITQHWKNLFSALIEDLCHNEERTIIFFWDELPLFIDNVKRTAGETTAMELLDVLRSLRQQYPKLRMVFTGSVGLHQVIKDLRNKRYGNDPTNDMRLVEVCPLKPEDGAHLARLLIEGEELRCTDDIAHLASRISEVTGHIPYYIHSLVARMKAEEKNVRSDEADKYLELLISDPNDPAHFHYYRERLHKYYELDHERIALAGLDALAMEALAFSRLLNLIRHQIPATEEEALRDVLRLLQQDHYVARRPDDDRYEFRYAIVCKWWKFQRT